MQAVKAVMVAGTALAVVAAAVWVLWPEPLLVDQVAVQTAPMEVTVATEGITRVRETWTVSAPIAGTVARTAVRAGDEVVQDQTEVAKIRPAAPPFLDARSRAQAEAAVTEAEAALRLAEVVLAQAQADASLAEAQLARNRALAERGAIAQRSLEDSVQKASTATATLETARFDLDLHRATLARMQAQLFGPDTAATEMAAGDCCIRIMAPQSGTVLAVADRNARPVQAGEVLLTIADLQDLQIEADLLSSDAVRVPLDAVAHIDRWGGDTPLVAKVVRIDPTGFTRVSALGIEEQRVRLHLDFITPANARLGLGDSYRVFVQIVIWSTPAARQVPQSALFRQDGAWAVFRSVDGRAVATPVTIGHSAEAMAEVLSGLNDGDQVIAYPGNRISDGAKIAARTAP